MKINIRKSIFETNSSSIHCIVIGNNGSNPEKFPEELVFEGGEFGWEHKVYNNTQSKANYLYTALMYIDNEEEAKDKISKTLSKWNVEAVFELYPKSEYGYYYYIDHGYELRDFVDTLLNNEEYLMNYLFSNESSVETGNDNEDIDWEAETPKNILFEYEKGN